MKAVSRIPRALAVSAAVGIACAAGLATATSAVAATPAATHVATKAAAPAYGHGGGGDENACGDGILAILNFCN